MGVDGENEDLFKTGKRDVGDNDVVSVSSLFDLWLNCDK